MQVNQNFLKQIDDESENTASDGEDSVIDLEIIQNQKSGDEMAEEELKYEIPKKMLEATKFIAHKLKNLEVDEFGDQIYDSTNVDDDKSQRLKKA